MPSIGSLLFLLAWAPAALHETFGPDGQRRDPRTTRVLTEICRSTISTRDLTLFANGTIRLREGTPGSESLALAEIERSEVAAIRRRLGALDLSETDARTSGPSGDWVERCRLILERDPEPPAVFEYGHLDPPSLALEGVLRIVEELVEKVRRGGAESDIPPGYRPALGDRLERRDGVLFEVVGPTADGGMFELRGVDAPLTVYVERDRIRTEFVRLLRRAGDEP
jgi:hypothetical protein